MLYVHGWKCDYGTMVLHHPGGVTCIDSIVTDATAGQKFDQLFLVFDH